MYGYVYITTNLINGRKYIGQRKFGKREPYLGSGKLLQKAIKKYGKESFKKEILCECLTKQELDEMEIKHIYNANAVNSDEYYNIDGGGTGRLAGYFHNEETKEKISKANVGHEVNEETKEKISKANLGHRHTEEVKQRISSSLVGKKKTKSHIKNMAEAHRGIKRTEEQRKRMSLGWHKRAIKPNVYLVTYPDGKTEAVYSLLEFCQKNDLHVGHMHGVAKKKYGYKSHRGFRVNILENSSENYIA